MQQLQPTFPLILLLAISWCCEAWLSSPSLFSASRRLTTMTTMTTTTTTTTTLTSFAKPNYNEDNDPRKQESEEDFRRRMAVVRLLQMSYYKPSATNPKGIVDSAESINEDQEIVEPSSPSGVWKEETGEIKHLPLFRAPWWEVPGRSNVLNIHEAIYTNMFEKILYGPKPWCFGHLYLEDGSRNLKSTELRHQLESYSTSKGWEDAAVLGCLMNISDYRRFADGRLLLLVHAMERFAVTDVQQKLPYGIAHVQILPDAEEIDPAVEFGMRDFCESDLAVPRAMAIQESVRYHDYEYDCDHKLPVPDRPDLDVTDVLGTDIAKVLPFCPFSKTLDPPEPGYVMELPKSASDDFSEDQVEEEQPSLEYQLLRQGVFQTPLVDPDYPQRQGLSVDELEKELWLSINNFLIQTRTPVSPVLLGLLPIHLDIWPPTVPDFPNASSANASNPRTCSNNTAYALGDDTATTTTIEPSKPFALKQIVSDLATLDSVEHDFVQVSENYPAHRRQRRLSYSAAHLLEKTAQVANELRPQLLATPSTRQRLRMVLEKFDQWQEQKWGEFQ